MMTRFLRFAGTRLKRLLPARVPLPQSPAGWLTATLSTLGVAADAAGGWGRDARRRSRNPPPSLPAIKFVPIPNRYKEPDKSGLNFTLKPGAQTINLELQ
jgi:hypothetical protein